MLVGGKGYKQGKQTKEEIKKSCPYRALEVVAVGLDV